jgi:hypothetical protein
MPSEQATKEKAMLVRRHTDMARTTAPLGLLIALLGAWAFFAPLVGPYFDFGFTTDETWAFSENQWTLSLIPGLVAMAGGIMLTVPRLNAGLGLLLALAGGVWLLVGPSLQPLWASDELGPQAASEGRSALLWIAYFYGTGALLTFLAGLGSGIVQRFRRVEVVEEVPTAVETPAEERTVVYG